MRTDEIEKTIIYSTVKRKSKDIECFCGTVRTVVCIFYTGIGGGGCSSM